MLLFFTDALSTKYVEKLQINPIEEYEGIVVSPQSNRPVMGIIRRFTRRILYLLTGDVKKSPVNSFLGVSNIPGWVGTVDDVRARTDAAGRKNTGDSH